MSPLEFGRELEAYDEARKEQVEREEREIEREIAQAWQVVAFYAEMTNKGKLPSLGEVLERVKPKPKAIAVPHVAPVASQLTFLSKKLGIPLRPISPEAERAFVRVDGRS